MEGVKTFQPKTTVHLPTNTPALSRISSLSNTRKIIVAAQAFDDDQTPSFFLDKYYKKHPEARENNLSIMEKKQIGEATISLSYLANKRKATYIFPWISIFLSTAGFKIIDSFIFQELMFALKCTFFNNRTIAS